MLQHYFYVYTALSILLFAHDTESKKNFKMFYFNTVEWSSNPHYVREYNIITLRNKTAMDIRIEFITTIPLSFWMHISASLNPTNGYQSRPLVQHDLNMCDFLTLRNSQLRGFIKLWLKNSLTHTKFPQRCPIQKGNYSWDGLSLEQLNLPRVFPNARYEVKVRFYVRKKPEYEIVTETLILLEMK